LKLYYSRACMTRILLIKTGCKKAKRNHINTHQKERNHRTIFCCRQGDNEAALEANAPSSNKQSRDKKQGRPYKSWFDCILNPNFSSYSKVMRRIILAVARKTRRAGSVASLAAESQQTLLAFLTGGRKVIIVCSFALPTTP